MEGSSIHCSLPTHLLIANSGGTTPYSQEFIQISKEQLIEYKSEFAYWKAMHAREIERGKEKDQKLEEPQARILDLEHYLFARKKEIKKTHCEIQSRSSGPSRAIGQQKGSNKGHGRRQHQNLPMLGEELNLAE